MAIEITLPENYGMVLLVAVTFAFQYTMVGFIYGGGARKAAFSKEFMEEKFLKEHQEAFGAESVPSPGGYPDMGSGRYAKALPYAKWFEFNKNQRIHANF